jgi:hypothetical protein
MPGKDASLQSRCLRWNCLQVPYLPSPPTLSNHGPCLIGAVPLWIACLLVYSIVLATGGILAECSDGGLLCHLAHAVIVPRGCAFSAVVISLASNDLTRAASERQMNCLHTSAKIELHIEQAP